MDEAGITPETTFLSDFEQARVAARPYFERQ
jgi:hypothetical protein